jgi:hypothetical protein
VISAKRTESMGSFFEFFILSQCFAVQCNKSLSPKTIGKVRPGDKTLSPHSVNMQFGCPQRVGIQIRTF